jgi:hypothetical protein
VAGAGASPTCLLPFGLGQSAQDEPTDKRAIDGMSKVLRMTGSSCLKRPLCGEVAGTGRMTQAIRTPLFADLWRDRAIDQAVERELAAAPAVPTRVR